METSEPLSVPQGTPDSYNAVQEPAATDDADQEPAKRICTTPEQKGDDDDHSYALVSQGKQVLQNTLGTDYDDFATWINKFGKKDFVDYVNRKCGKDLQVSNTETREHKFWRFAQNIFSDFENVTLGDDFVFTTEYIEEGIKDLAGFAQTAFNLAVTTPDDVGDGAFLQDWLEFCMPYLANRAMVRIGELANMKLVKDEKRPLRSA